MPPRRSSKTGFFLFLLPIAFVTAIVVFGLVSSIETSSGTLVVEAETVVDGSSRFVSVMATVGGIQQTTPFNISLARGTYVVNYGALKWYYSPPARSVTVIGGKSAYAIGVYLPIPVHVAVDNVGPNVTSISAEHGVTPVIWFNTGTSTIEVSSNFFSSVVPPGTNYTSFFSEVGVFQVELLPLKASVTVNVV